ncbi:hypothetical protein NA644_06710 [Pseudomonas stutzeri]|uniref:Uncharacterized protein n=1 Tax=Stutzerimonas stutzeri TaxID=316 RepID=A0A2N8SUC4_STUST|nr:hypothetical protein [Stutzerimonas stutzeri]EQM79704.1 hypothetical protein L686_10710 [Stutzerimonas stutzeri MF28]MCQ4249001.1 hypothetical protein [Stutzerimonas stutzeri]PNG06059.1 hypothetical protein CXL00_09565 [Stutzerimonas stutzeri]
MNHPSEYLAELYACVCLTARSASTADQQKHRRLKAGSAAARTGAARRTEYQRTTKRRNA